QTHTYIDTMAEIQNRPILFNRKPTASVSDVLFLARQAKGLGLIVIDYLGILRHEAGRSLYERVTATSGALKRMARAVHVPVLCLAQLNRETEGRTGGKPRLSDLRDSGAIEQDADGVLLLHSPVERDKLAHGEPLPLFLTAAKNRHGGTGEIGFDFHLQNSRIVQQRQSHMEEQP
ncbi:MAG: DnaB-like helicase C-terminal domain-containing protein, partial [Oscillospiraceae bacterium]|nr:DnaB-like helicase C-terminal domain-containing protein [Oscillospiraceae bacterium]